MPKIINIRNVPDDVYRELKRRAANAGLSLPTYALREFERACEIPTVEELRERIASRATK